MEKAVLGLDKILTIPEIAKYLRVSRTTVWRWCNEGKLPAFKVGNTWRIHRSDLEKIVGQNLREQVQAQSGDNNEGDKIVEQKISSFFISVGLDADAEDEELDNLARQLLAELDDLDTVSVELAGEDKSRALRQNSGQANAKGLSTTIGSILVKIAEVGGITSLISILGSWLSRDERRTITLQVGENKLEVTGITETEQTRLIQWFQTQTGLRLEG